jgi:hypothetical protein
LFTDFCPLALVFALSIAKSRESNPFTSDANTEAKIPISTNMRGKRAFFSTNMVMSKIGTEITTNKI